MGKADVPVFGQGEIVWGRLIARIRMVTAVVD